SIHYGISVMHCMTVSLAQGGAGLGTVWGIEKAREMLAEAGFSDVEVVDSPRPQNCIYICRA
ncbi:MAG: methyltransferase type 12, partial [Alphaproteobacteria bacterium]|nr:methyltransferase type 12 [Alphaproteobacteria bacterium]